MEKQPVLLRKMMYACVHLRETENWNLSSKNLFYKDCSLGSVKTRLTTSPCESTDE